MARGPRTLASGGCSQRLHLLRSRAQRPLAVDGRHELWEARFAAAARELTSATFWAKPEQQRQYAMSTRMDRNRAAAFAPLALVACLAAVSCGGSSRGTSSGAHAVARPASAPGASHDIAPNDPQSDDDAPQGPTFRASAARSALAAFATCMRKHGVDLPPPRTAGSGPIFDTRGVRTNGQAFAAALSMCRNDLSPVLRRLRQTAPIPPRPPTQPFG